MKKTIRIIDLLNKIANGEEVPKSFKYKDKHFQYNDHDYWCDEIDGWFSVEVLGTDNLNDYVEILDEEEFEDIEELSDKELWLTENQQITMVKTINQIIKNQKKIIEKLKEEGK